MFGNNQNIIYTDKLVVMQQKQFNIILNFHQDNLYVI